MESSTDKEIRILIIGPTKPLGGMENCVILHASLELGEGYRLYHLDNKYHPIVRKSKVLKLIYLYATLLPKMKKIIKDEKIDIVHIHSTSFKNVFKNIQIQDAVKKLGVKSIIHIHGGYFDRFYDELPGFLKKKLVHGLNSTDGLICLSEGWKKFFTGTFKDANVYVLENAIDLEPFLETGEYRDYKVEDEFSVLFLGRISKMKGCFDLVEVAKKLRGVDMPIKFVLAGRSERGETSKLKWTIHDEKLGDRFDLPGEVTGFRREDLFRKADAFILPSYAEGMPITVLEAFAVGLPTIATNVGATPEVIQDGENGLLFEPGNIEGMTNALVRLANDKTLRERLGKKGYEDVQKRFSAQRWVDELRRIYKEVSVEK